MLYIGSDDEIFVSYCQICQLINVVKLKYCKFINVCLGLMFALLRQNHVRGD